MVVRFVAMAVAAAGIYGITKLISKEVDKLNPEFKAAMKDYMKAKKAAKEKMENDLEVLKCKEKVAEEAQKTLDALDKEPSFEEFMDSLKHDKQEDYGCHCGCCGEEDNFEECECDCGDTDDFEECDCGDTDDFEECECDDYEDTEFEDPIIIEEDEESPMDKGCIEEAVIDALKDDINK